MKVRRYTKLVINKLRANDYQPLNRITLSRSAVLNNIYLFQKANPNFEIIPVLKSNAYGHGLEEIAQILNATSCRYLAVDGYFEAAKIRDITKHHILVLGYILPSNVHLLDAKKCSFVVQDIGGLRAFGKLNKIVNIHLELNTGFNRLGLQPEELKAYLKTLQEFPKLRLEGIMSHLLDADNAIDNHYNTLQTKLYDNFVADILKIGFKPKLLHLSQTAGSLKIKSHYTNAIRLGIGTYGINPLQPKDRQFSQLNDLRPVLELKSKIIKTYQLKEGDSVGYNATFVAPKALRIGVLPLGYYEGVPRQLSNKGFVAHNGQILPIIGRVCMNHTMIDLNLLNLGVGDEITIISSEASSPNSIINLQAKFGVFSYEILTKLSSTIHRQIID